jgi:RNA recognition motif-containing protein
VEFEDHESAKTALETMNGRRVFDQVGLEAVCFTCPMGFQGLEMLQAVCRLFKK